MVPATQMDSLAAMMQRSTAFSPNEQIFTAADGGSGSTTPFEGPATRFASSSRSFQKRAHFGTGEPDGTFWSDGALNKNARLDASHSQQPMDIAEEGASASTAHNLEVEVMERTPMMFAVDAKAPKASGRRGIMAKPTDELVYLAWKAVRALCATARKELSDAYGNFDQLVGLGWLIGDLLFGRLIDKADAFKIGRKAGKLGPTLEAAFSAPRIRVLGLKLVDGERRDHELAEAATQETKLRGKLFELPSLDELLMPPPPPPPPVTPAERHTQALNVLQRATRQETQARNKMKSYEDQMDQMGPEADWFQLSALKRKLCDGGRQELSAAASHQLDSLAQSLQRIDDAILNTDANWKRAHTAWTDARDVRHYAQLESDETERVLRAAEAAEEVAQRRAVMEAELAERGLQMDEELAKLTERIREEKAYIERIDEKKAGMHWEDGSPVYRADGSRAPRASPRATTEEHEAPSSEPVSDEEDSGKCV
jgi:hypothetical protein